MDEYFSRCLLIRLNPGTGETFLEIPGGNRIAVREISDTSVRNAFDQAFKEGYRKIIAVENRNSPEPEFLKEAFLSLKLIEFCLGPRNNGEIYLLGMNNFYPAVFPETDIFRVSLKEYIRKIGELKLAIYRLGKLD